MSKQRTDERSVTETVVSLGILGPIEAWDASGKAVRVTRGQQRVLAMLLESANEVVRAEVLQDRLWPDEDAKSASAILQTNIWSLKNLIGRGESESTPALRRHGSGYELRLDATQLDWFRFQRLRAGAARAIARKRPDEAKGLLLDARRLWRGDTLVGPSGELFSAPFVRHLEAARADVELQLIDVGLALGEHHELIPPLRHLTGRHPQDESLARLLMLALFRAGRQAEALDVYYACRRTLAESGLVPTPALSATQVDILTHAPDAVAPTTKPKPAVAGLGVNGTLLVGRWHPATPPAWALGDAELIMSAEDRGGEVLEGVGPSLVARFDDADRALAAAVAIQGGLKSRGGPLGRFVVHDGSRAATRGVRLLDLARRLLGEAEAGQILVFRSAADPAERRLADGAELRELGEHQVPGLDGAIRLFQLMAPQFAGSARPFSTLAPPPRHNLPVFPNQFIGREEMVEELALALSRRRFLTLTGPGGIGKTRLAVETARTLLSEFGDGSWFVELEWLSDPGLIAGSVADAVGLDRSRSLDALDVLTREMAGRHALVILDTCEHLLSEAREFVERLLVSCPHVSVIATSLQSLGGDQEEVVAVPPLETPVDGEAQADVKTKSAVRLFYDHLGADADADADVELVGEICRLIDGIPLTVALAAARAAQLGPAELARELRRTFAEGSGLRLLDTGGRLHDTLAWSFSRLDDGDRRALVAFSLFAGPFGLDEARELQGGPSESDLAASLCALVDCSALVVDVDGTGVPRYRLLQPVRAFASSRLDEDPAARNRLSRRHAEMYLDRAQQADRAFGGPGEQRELTRMDACLQNVRAALRWSIEGGDAPLALALSGSLWRYWFTRGHLAEGLRWSMDALALERVATVAGTRTLGGSSYLAWWMGDLQYTAKSAEENASRAEAMGDAWGRAWAPLGLVAASMFSPDGPPPGADLRPAIAYFVEAGLPWEANQALQLLAGQEWFRGNYEAACAHFGEAVELSRSAGSQSFMDSLQGHGLMLALMGRADEGAREVQAGLELADRRRDPVGICHALTYRAAIASYDDDFDESARLYALALKVAADTGEIWIVQWALDGLAAWVAPTRAEVAARLLGQVEALADATGIRLAPMEQAAHAVAVRRVAAKLGDAGHRAMNEGRTMGLPAAVDLALGLGA